MLSKNNTSNIVVCQGLIELLEVCVVDMLEYQGWGSADRVLNFFGRRTVWMNTAKPWLLHAKRWRWFLPLGFPVSWFPSWFSSSSLASTSSPHTSRCCWCWSTRTPPNIYPCPTSAQAGSHPEKSGSIPEKYLNQSRPTWLPHSTTWAS